MQPESPKKLWRSTPTPNLVIYAPAGSYYLQARVAGKPRRVSLHTTHYKVAVARLGEKLRELRQGVGSRKDGPVTIHDALALVRASVASDPALKANTRRSYIEELDDLSRGRAAAPPETPLARLGSAELAAWWQRTAGIYAPQRANHLLMFLRRALKAARKAGAMAHDPSEDLRRVKIPRTRLNLVTPEQFRALLLSIRSQGKQFSAQAADWIEWMACSGMRPGEIAALTWQHIGEQSVAVTGGDEGTKNREVRFVPITPPLASLIARLRQGRTRVGLVFTMTPPRDALANACQRLGFPHLRIYDLRHLFASMCNQSGVDVPTFAKWLGHKDGGALAMRTYVHPNDEHGQKSAQKVMF